MEYLPPLSLFHVILQVLCSHDDKYVHEHVSAKWRENSSVQICLRLTFARALISRAFVYFLFVEVRRK